MRGRHRYPVLARWLGRSAAAAVAGAVLAAGPGAAPAGADPAGPSDYRSEVVSVEPPQEVISLRFIGGDSFIELAVDEGHEVVVAGYQGEPYLWFDDRGMVHENQRSPATALNDDRYGQAEPGAGLDVHAEPDWLPVGTGGRYAWHDHRTHWMNQARPPGASPGDQILEAVVPLTVDGAAVSVTVASFWVTGSPTATWGAAVLGALVGIGGLLLARRRAIRWWVVLGIAALAAILGIVAFWSVPGETGPPLTLWLLPVLALVAAVASRIVSGRRAGSARDVLVVHGLLALAGMELALWGLLRWEAVVRAVIPSDAPGGLDRASIVAAVVVGAGAAALSGAGLVRVRVVDPEPRPQP